MPGLVTQKKVLMKKGSKKRHFPGGLQGSKKKENPSEQTSAIGDV